MALLKGAGPSQGLSPHLGLQVRDWRPSAVGRAPAVAGASPRVPVSPAGTLCVEERSPRTGRERGHCPCRPVLTGASPHPVVGLWTELPLDSIVVRTPWPPSVARFGGGEGQGWVAAFCWAGGCKVAPSSACLPLTTAQGSLTFFCLISGVYCAQQG